MVYGTPQKPKLEIGFFIEFLSLHFPYTLGIGSFVFMTFFFAQLVSAGI